MDIRTELSADDIKADGADAVILSNRRVDGGVEIAAAVDYEDAWLRLATQAEPAGEPAQEEQPSAELPEPVADCPTPDYSPAELAGLLPFSVFGDYVNDLEGLDEALHGASGPNAMARSTCTATRLNIAAGELGWYSTGSRSPRSRSRAQWVSV